MHKFYVSVLIAACLVGLLLGLRSMFPRSGIYSGTIRPYCGSDDGAASLMWLRADSGHYRNIHVFADHLYPDLSKRGNPRYALNAGTKIVVDPTNIESVGPDRTSMISVCRDQNFTRHCINTESAIISIESNEHGLVTGDLSFRLLYIFKRNIKFKAKLLPPPQNLFCG